MGPPSDAQPVAGIPPNAARVAVRPLLAQQYSGVSDSQRVVLRDAAAWQAFWQEAVRNLTPAPPTPAVDFAMEMVVAVALGQRPTGGYDISIDGAYQAEGQLFVVVRQASPPPGAGVTQALTDPVAAVALPRTDAAVVFVTASN